MIKIKCKNCGKKFLAYFSTKRKFCSKKCVYEGREKRKKFLVSFICKNCGKTFLDFSSNKRNYCSLFCKYKAHKPTINEKHYRFPKGYIPCNKGVKGWIHKKSFQKGHIPWNKDLKGYKRDNSYLDNPEFKKKHSEAVSKGKIGKLRYDRRGKNSNFWKGGISKLSDRIRRTEKYKRWRKKVFERDNYTCQKCKVRSGNRKTVYLEAHHKKEFSKILAEKEIKTLDDAYNCKELWDINNGKTLCLDCHTRNGRPNKDLIKKINDVR